MAVKTFCELETRFKCKIEVDIQNIDQHYKVDENQLYLSKSYDYTVNFKSEKQFQGYVLFADQKKKKSLYLVVSKDRLYGLIIKYSLTFNGKDFLSKESIFGSANVAKWRFSNENKDEQG